MKTIKELAPIWASYVEEHGLIPWRMDDNVQINGGQPAIGNPVCCFIGEARGGGCYYDELLRDRNAKQNKDGSHVMVKNPEYCEQCSNMSQEFLHLSEDYRGNNFNKEEYEELCRAYEKHYDESHNGDRCKE